MLLLKQSKDSKTTDSFLWSFIQLWIDRVFLSAFLECIWTAASGCDINESSCHLKQNEMEDSLFIRFRLISTQSLNTNIIWSTVINAECTMPATSVIIWEPFCNFWCTEVNYSGILNISLVLSFEILLLKWPASQKKSLSPNAILRNLYLWSSATVTIKEPQKSLCRCHHFCKSEKQLLICIMAFVSLLKD